MSESAQDQFDVPPLVARAAALAVELGFPLTRDGGPGPSCCLPDVGRVLAMLVAARPGGRFGETGTGVGYGAAWMASAMAADATLVSVELDPVRAAAAAGLFADDPRVTVVAGDALVEIPRRAPFDLLFVDSGGYDAVSLEALVELLRPGGQLVVDDVTPLAAQPPHSPYRENDYKREALLGSPRMRAVEIVCPNLFDSLLVGTRVQ